MSIAFMITVLATNILANGAHARVTRELPISKSTSNEFIVDDAFPTMDDLAALGRYLDKVNHELEDMDNWTKDEFSDINVMPVSKFNYA